MTSTLKLHLRLFTIHRATLRVVTLRPQTGVRFSSNYFHDTWHILGGHDGAAILGRLLWGLAFQNHPGTLVLIDRDHLVPTPFEADPPDPILLVQDRLTSVDLETLRALKLRLRRSPGRPSTIRWHTFGMPTALESEAEGRWHPSFESRRLLARERMSRRAGFICYTAPREILRNTAVAVYRMSSGAREYYPLGEDRYRNGGIDGEFQVIENFAANVSSAIVARQEVLGGAARRITDHEERQAIYRRRLEARGSTTGRDG